MYSEYNGVEVNLFGHFKDVGMQRSEPSNVVASLFWTTLYTQTDSHERNHGLYSGSYGGWERCLSPAPRQYGSG